jgi:membrane-bound lytic murein transglycosylase D
MSYAFAYHNQHNITSQSCPLPIAVDTIMVSRPLHLKQIEATLGTPIDILQGLNPQYLEDIVPAVGKSYPVMLPIADATRYISNTETIHALDSVYLAEYLYPNNLTAATKELIESETIHKVKSGETLSAIARKYGVTLTQIKQWNNIKNVNSLKIGQRITIRK